VYHTVIQKPTKMTESSVSIAESTSSGDDDAYSKDVVSADKHDETEEVKALAKRETASVRLWRRNVFLMVRVFPLSNYADDYRLAYVSRFDSFRIFFSPRVSTSLLCCFHPHLLCNRHHHDNNNTNRSLQCAHSSLR